MSTLSSAFLYCPPALAVGGLVVSRVWNGLNAKELFLWFVHNLHNTDEGENFFKV